MTCTNIRITDSIYLRSPASESGGRGVGGFMRRVTRNRPFVSANEASKGDVEESLKPAAIGGQYTYTMSLEPLYVSMGVISMFTFTLLASLVADGNRIGVIKLDSNLGLTALSLLPLLLVLVTKCVTMSIGQPLYVVLFNVLLIACSITSWFIPFLKYQKYISASNFVALLPLNITFLLFFAGVVFSYFYNLNRAR